MVKLIGLERPNTRETKAYVETGPRCGNCRWSIAAKDGSRECHGAPPTPILAGFVENPITRQPQPNILLFFPNLPPTMMPCALWALEKPAVAAADEVAKAGA